MHKAVRQSDKLAYEKNHAKLFLMKNSLSYKAYLKSPYKSIKHSTYFEIYDELFSRYRNRSITFVEIGVLSGGSLFMWREFFGPKARIIGVDLNPIAKKWKEHGFEIYIGSQSDQRFWEEFIKDIGPVDVILDDGGHKYEQQIVTTEMLLSNVKDFGMLVVEDTHTSYMKSFGPKRYTFVNYSKKMIDKINYRFGSFNPAQSDKRVWSVQSFESIIAFHINRQATNLVSERTNNGGIDDFAKDFRDFGNHGFWSIDFFQKIVSKFSYIKYNPGVRFLAKTWDYLGNYLIKRESFKKYF